MAKIKLEIMTNTFGIFGKSIVNLVGPKKKWILLAKGGGFRRWSGNIQNVINWDVKVREHYRRDHVARIIPEYPDPSALGFICFRYGRLDYGEAADTGRTI